MTKPEKLKQCAKCKGWKVLDAFTRDYHEPDHRRARCRACNAKRKPAKGELWQTKYADDRGAKFTKMRYGKKGLSVQEIADLEGVSRQAIHQSITRYVYRHGMEHLLDVDAKPREVETPTVTPPRRERRVKYEPPDIPVGSIYKRRA